MMHKINNPILSGNYPDPSICRVDDTFYLVCSSFELTPGLPIFQSKDLSNWTQIGNALTEDNNFYIERDGVIGGIMAPTIRYHKGTFYIIDTNLSDRGNFIITANNAAGPWSEPHWLTDIPDIDASIFFDDDDKCYLVGIGDVIETGNDKKERGFWIVEFDINTFKVVGERVPIFDSALRRAWSPEAPHIYHVGDYYYLLFAEGGTEHNHAVMVARSKDLFGFYEGNPANPIMTHRHFGYTSPITNVGHADLVELQDGSWYSVLLGSRLIDGPHKNLGRETFICPVIWEKHWPLFSPKTGKIEESYNLPSSLTWTEVPSEPEKYDFNNDYLPQSFFCWGTQKKRCYTIKNSFLELSCIRQAPDDDVLVMDIGPNKFEDRYCCFVGQRQIAKHSIFETKMIFDPKNQERAGLSIIQAMNHQIHFEKLLINNKPILRVVLITMDYEGYPFFPNFSGKTNRKVLSSIPYNEKELILRMELDNQDYTFYYGKNEENLSKLTTIDGRLINTEKLGCLSGVSVGMYATGSGQDSENIASFDWFINKKISD